MKIIERYVLQSFLSAFFLSWLVLSFVLTIGLLVKITQYIIEGLPAHSIGLFMLVGFPGTLTLTVPIALLVSALLVFSRLSADSEIAAMRACGINLMRIMKWPILVGVACAALGIYVNNEIVPRSHEVGRNMRSLISVEVGLDLLEPGRMIDDFPDLKIYFQRKEGNWLHDLLIFDSRDSQGTREIRAEKALVSTNGSDVVLDMYKVRVDPIEVGRPGVAVADRFQHVIPEAMRRRSYMRKEKDFRYWELHQAIKDIRANVRGYTRDMRRLLLSVHRTEYHTRFVYAFASICFVMIGVPLGIKTHRKESTIGMAVSLVVSMVFYLFVILAQSLDKTYLAAPYILVWIPVAACGALAAYLIPRNL